MKDFERLRVAGTEEERALLRSAEDPSVPPGFREEVRRAVEERISPRRRQRSFRRLAFGIASTLIAGTALAYGVARYRAAKEPPSPSVPAPNPGQPTHRSAIAPSTTTSSDPAAPPIPSSSPSHPAHRQATAPITAPEPAPESITILAPPTYRPTPTSTPTPVAAVVTPAAASASPVAEPARLVIGREGRQEVSVTVDATRVQGKVRSTPVAIELKGGQILGKAGIENVSLWIRGYVASGTIAGRDVGYELSPTNDGHLLRGSLPSHTVRVELTSKSLSWYPGCDQPLALVGPGVYEGRCSWGGKARVAIPEPLQKMAPMAKLILLGILLTERDPVLENGTPELFGIPDWPKR